MIDLVARLLLFLFSMPVAIYGAWRAIVGIDLTRDLPPADMSQPRFQLIDFMALFLMLQPPLLMVTFAARIQDKVPAALLVFGGLYSLVYVGIWWWGVAALSAIRVEHTWRRALFLGILQPVGMALCVASLWAMVFAPVALFQVSLGEAAGLALGILLYGTVTLLYAWACNWVRAASKLLVPDPGDADDSTFP